MGNKSGAKEFIFPEAINLDPRAMNLFVFSKKSVIRNSNIPTMITFLKRV
jgi:hypothetical protein